jgi:KDO2-lipid IV(A) lauroyltransferase
MDIRAKAVDFLAGILRPGRATDGFAAFLSCLLNIAGPRRNVAAQNLSVVLPDASPEKIKRLLNETYNHLVWVAIEFIMLQRDPRQALDWVTAENAELLDDLNGKGAILVTGHVGNWELLAAWLAQRGHKLTAIIRESDDSAERGLIERMRTHCGVKCMSKTTAMMSVVSLLKRGEFLGILPDQHGGAHGLRVPFFGIETSTSQGPAFFAYLTGKPIIMVFSHRISPCRHKVRVAPPIEWKKLNTREETIIDITRRINIELERIILDAPGQWLAQHRRFREHNFAACREAAKKPHLSA